MTTGVDVASTASTSIASTSIASTSIASTSTASTSSSTHLAPHRVACALILSSAEIFSASSSGWEGSGDARPPRVFSRVDPVRTSGERFARARYIAAVYPAAPPPTTTTISTVASSRLVDVAATLAARLRAPRLGAVARRSSRDGRRGWKVIAAFADPTVDGAAHAMSTSALRSRIVPEGTARDLHAVHYRLAPGSAHTQ